VELLTPGEPDQQSTLELIQAIKAGETGPASRSRLRALVERLAEQGAQAVVLGCTELGLVADGDQAVPLVDSVAELARAAVTRVKGRTTEEG
jgi:aspartate racemase